MNDTKDRSAAVVRGNNQFAMGLYGTLRGQPGNLFFSPFSLSTALAMTCAGAGSETAAQMVAVMRFPFNEQQLHAAFATVIQELHGDGKLEAYKLYIANALWGQSGYSFLPGFVELANEYYGAGVNEVDFDGSTEPARQAINAWVLEQTQGTIKDFLKPGLLDRTTRLVLTNAIYFKGNWALPFDKARTRDEPFHVTVHRTIQVPMMRRTAQFKYLAQDEFQALELAYVGDLLSMVVFLPRTVDGLSGFEQMVTAENLAIWLTELRPRKVDVYLPRFKVTGTFILNDVLSRMGMPLAFDPVSADFSGLDGGTSPGLFISAVVHQAYVDVNEEGTEAAAITAKLQAVRGPSPGEPPVFRADRPFSFLIRDNRSGSTLFMGRVVSPQQ